MSQDKIIIHVDMDAFYASVEMRDNPSIRKKPVIIGSLPHERGVVATCNYEARKYGVHSAMNIKEAYKLCPKGIYIHPNYEKYKKVSKQIHKIWDEYAIEKEAIALDEAYLDITDSVKSIDEARKIAKTIKDRILKEIGLTCSIGLSYSKIAAKTASEEKKPNGYFEILTKEDFVNLVIDREVDALHTVGKKSKEKLNENKIFTIRDIQNNKEKVLKLFGKRGEFIYNISYGIDDRELKPYNPENAQSLSREVTFQKDENDLEFFKDILFLLAICIENQLKKRKLHGNGVSLKITYSDMKTITRQKLSTSCDSAIEIQEEALKLLEDIEKRSIRLIGTGLYQLRTQEIKQLSIDDYLEKDNNIEERTNKEFERLKEKYKLNFKNNIEKLYQTDTLFKTIEYMRKHRAN